MAKVPILDKKIVSQVDDDEIDLRIFWHTFYKYKWTILGLTLLIALLSTFVAFSLQPIYRSTAMLLIESDKAKVISIEEVYGISAFKQGYYQTQLEILKSWALAEKLVKKLNLISHPTFNPDLQQQGFNWRHLFPSAWFSPQVPPTLEKKYKAIIKAVMSKLSVSSVRGSQLVKISFDSHDPQLAAKIPNTLVDLYIESDLEARLEMTNKAASWLTERVEGLRKNLRESEKALQNYMDSQNLINIAGVKSVAAKQIEETATNLVNARQQLAKAESVYMQVKTLQNHSAETFESIPAVLNHPLVQILKKVELDAERKISELSERYGQKHPKIIAAKAEINTAKANTNKQIKRVIEGIRKEYEVAIANVTALERGLKKSKKQIQELNRKEYQLRVLERDVDLNRQLYDLFLTRFKETDASQDVQALQSTVGRLVDKARISSLPYKPQKKLIVGISLVLGFFLEYLDNTIKNGEDVEHKLGLPLLGALPKLNVGKLNEFKPRWMFLKEQKSSFAESIRTIRTGIMLSGLDNPQKILLVTSSVPNEGKTTFATNQAFALGQMEKTLLIDADMRRPSVAKAFGWNNKVPGLAELVAGTQKFDECIHHPGEGEMGGIDVIPSGAVPPNPLELLSSTQFGEILKKLSKKYTYIVIDSAPTMLVSDALVLAKYASLVLYVVKAEATPYQIVQESLKRMHRIEAPLKNIVLNQVHNKHPSKYNYYGKYYGKYGYHKGYYGGYYGEHGYYS